MYKKRLTYMCNLNIQKIKCMYTHIWDEVEWVKLVIFLKRIKLVQDRARCQDIYGFTC